jgi:ferrous iron transport protein A
MITCETTLDQHTARDQQTTLDQLRPGQCGRIIRIDGVDGIASRLREMGFVPGQTVQYLRTAPLGDPVKCSVQGSRIAVRCGEARRVFIERTG